MMTLLLFFLLLLPAVEAEACGGSGSPCYVSTAGNNAVTKANNNSTTPWRTLTFAVTQLTCGDILYVRGGTYSTETTVSFSSAQSCTVGNEIQVIAANLATHPGDSQPLISWTDHLNTANGIFYTNSAGINIVGLNLFNAYTIKMDKGTRLKWLRNKIHGFGENGIGNGSPGGCYQCVADRNEIYENGDVNIPLCAGYPGGIQFCNGVHGMYVAGKSWTITNNLIYRNMAYGLQMHGMSNAQCSEASDDPNYCGTGGLIANNTIAHEINRNAITLWNESVGAAVWTVENNIFLYNSQNVAFVNGIRTDQGGSGGLTGTILRNNISYGTGGSTAFQSGTCPGCTVSTNACNSGGGTGCTSTITVPPAMVNAPVSYPGTPDYHLVTGSSAIDFGLDLTTLFTNAGIAVVDFDGVARTGTWEVGAYVFGGPPPDTTAPAPPTGVTVQ